MPNRLTDHPLVQDTSITVSRWSRFFGDTISESIESAVQKWKDDTKRDGRFKTSFWGCFDPIDLCLITTFCPCVTCGKTFYRLHYQGDMSEYEIVNAPCLAYGALCYCCCPSLAALLCSGPLALQTCQIRKEGDIGGNLVIDCCKVWCCNCCSLIQNEKESTMLLEGRGAGLGGGDGVVESQHTGGTGVGENMIMEPQGVQKDSNNIAAEEVDELSVVYETRPDTARQAVDMVNQTDIPTSLNDSPVVNKTTPHTLRSDHEQDVRPPPAHDAIDTEVRDHGVILPTVTEPPMINATTFTPTTDDQIHDMLIQRSYSTASLKRSHDTSSLPNISERHSADCSTAASVW